MSMPCKNCGNQTWGKFCGDDCQFEYYSDLCQCDACQLVRDTTDADGHWSDCSVHNEPAMPKSECNCGLFRREGR
jgi:hypothetical protein